LTKSKVGRLGSCYFVMHEFVQIFDTVAFYGCEIMKLYVAFIPIVRYAPFSFKGLADSVKSGETFFGLLYLFPSGPIIQVGS